MRWWTDHPIIWLKSIPVLSRGGGEVESAPECSGQPSPLIHLRRCHFALFLSNSGQSWHFPIKLTSISHCYCLQYQLTHVSFGMDRFDFGKATRSTGMQPSRPNLSLGQRRFFGPSASENVNASCVRDQLHRWKLKSNLIYFCSRNSLPFLFHNTWKASIS